MKTETKEPSLREQIDDVISISDDGVSCQGSGKHNDAKSSRS